MFGLRFPERSLWDVRRPWLKWLLIGPLAVQAFLITLGDVAQSEGFAVAARVRRLQPPDGVVIGLLMLGVGLFFLQIGIKSGVAAPDARRRLRLLHFGTAISMTPCFVLLVSSLVLRRSTDFENLPGWLVLPSLATLFLFPVTMAYVIVVERAMDVRVVIRQGVRYALARGGVRALRVATTVALIAAAISLWENPQASPAMKVAIILGAAAVSRLSTQFTGRLAAAVDRRFFREAYEAERLLGDLAENVRSIVETEPLLQTVAETISSALHIPRVATFLETDGLFRPALALGYARKPDVSLSAHGPTVEKLRTNPASLPVHGDGPGSWGNQLPERAVDEKDALRRLGAELLLPLSTKERLLGFLSLGPKLSEEPYSSGDERLLRSVAAQTGLALENSRLAEAIASEVAQRERQRRELEIAREVQEQLFPQSQPSAPGFDYCGACRPARHVGGDYYDFLALPEEVVGIAIGDVSGKGIPAALLMASLQASLRAQAPLRTLDLPGLVTSMNRLLYDLSSANRYATFFYAQLDTRRRALTYVNAGHNPPMLLRNGELLRLDVGGPAVGLLPETSYEQGSLALERGDLLVAYTDGVSEAMSPAEEEWGEERLVAALRGNNQRAAADVLAAVMAAADAFASGASQHDDMTLVVVRAADH